MSSSSSSVFGYAGRPSAMATILVVSLTLCCVSCSSRRDSSGGGTAPTATNDDSYQQFATTLWQALAQAGLVGPEALRSHRYVGRPPHRGWLQQIDGLIRVGERIEPTIVLAQVDASGAPQAFRVMVKRPSAADNWFWASYKVSGQLLSNSDDGTAASQQDRCRGCHRAAPGGDYVFSHNRYR